MSVVVAVTALVVLLPEAPTTQAPVAQPNYTGHPMVGAWIGPSLFDADEAEAGIDVRPDGRWSTLVLQPGGAYLRAGGWENEGWWAPSDGMGRGVIFTRDGGDMSGVSTERFPSFVRLAPGAVVGDAPVQGPHGVFVAPTGEAFAAAVAGLWLRTQPGDEAGVELRSEGRWSTLRRPSDGTLVRSVGWDEEGDWSVGSIGDADHPSYQLDLRRDSGGGPSWFSVLSADRAFLRFGDTDYRRAPASAAIRTAPGAGVVTGRYRPTSQDDFVRTVLGRWLLQTKPPTFRPDEAGLDVRADGSWSWLARRRDGSLTATIGGRWEVLDTSVMNGPNVFAIDLQVDHPNGFNPLPVFSADRQVMRLSETQGTADYRRITPPG